MFDTDPPADAPPLQQSAGYESALRSFGHAPLRLSDGTLALRRRLPGGLTLLMLPRAAPMPLDHLPALLAEVGLRRCLLLLSPDRPTRYDALPLVSPTHVAELSLHPQTTHQRGALHQKWRNRLTRAESSGTTVRIGNPADLNWLLTADAAQRRARGYRGWPVALTRAWCAANPRDTLLLTALAHGRPIAAALFLIHGAAASYHIGHSTPRGRQLNAHNLILWQAMRHLSGMGVTRLDLGPIDTETAPGLARFKLGTGAHTRPLGGTWLWVPALGSMLRPLARLDRRLMAG
ncbi:GNAT family N-acetyltransferase [Seohaeicola saemankumensis]|nr:GNAT family N-acetyltransferase [Seohaeicola saemankumensis]MCA0872850.1 GNAT family N-acetyltransferase [Seohaeicola saemankumensis]